MLLILVQHLPRDRERLGVSEGHMAWLLGLTRREYRELEAGRLHIATTCTGGSSRCAGGPARGTRDPGDDSRRPMAVCRASGYQLGGAARSDSNGGARRAKRSICPDTARLRGMGTDGQEWFEGAIGALRIGETIRKPSGPWTPTVQAMLRHLRDASLDSVPEPLGTDEEGRESMSFIPGTTAARPWPEYLLTLDGVADLADWLRGFHDAIADFRPIDPVWRSGPRPIMDGEIALHGDLGPWNTVWDGDQLVGVIDWDLAEPGQPIDDVAFLALQLVPLRDDEYARRAGFVEEVPRAERLRVLCDTYAAVAPAEVIKRVAWIHERDLDRTRTWGPLGLEPWATFHADGDERIIHADSSWLDLNAAGLFT